MIYTPTTENPFASYNVGDRVQLIFKSGRRLDGIVRSFPRNSFCDTDFRMTVVAEKGGGEFADWFGMATISAENDWYGQTHISQVTILKVLSDEQLRGMSDSELDAVSFSDDTYSEDTVKRADMIIDEREQTRRESLQGQHDAQRKLYLAGTISHQEFYRWLGNRLGVTRDSLSQEILRRLPNSTDEYMNDIPLRLWDAHDFAVRQRAGRAGMRSWSQSDTVCVLKALARELKDKSL